MVELIETLNNLSAARFIGYSIIWLLSLVIIFGSISEIFKKNE